MKSASAGKGITNAEFDALVGDLVTTLNKFNIGAHSQPASLVNPSKSTQAFLTHHQQGGGRMKKLSILRRRRATI